MGTIRALRVAEGHDVTFENARSALEGVSLRGVDQLAADSWGEYDVLDSGGETVLEIAREVLAQDISCLEDAVNHPSDAMEAFDLPSGGVVWWFDDLDTGRRLSHAAARLRDFGLLTLAGFKALPEKDDPGSRDNTLWSLEGPTHAKHRLLRRYLDAWIPIMSRWESRLVLLEGFAGPGRYADGEAGSPLIMLNAFLEHSARPAIETELVYFFIEERLDRAEFLEAEIARLDLPDQLKVTVIHGRYEDEFGSVVNSLNAAKKKLAPTFAFVDPFGYAHASMNLTGRFLEFERCEVLIFVPLYHVNRFVEREGQESAMTALFGDEKVWRSVAEIGPEQSRMNFLHDLFRDQLQNECKLKYVRSFEIVTGGTNSGYHLFFGTNHIVGLEKMKEAMWAVDPLGGSRFQDSTDPDQLILLEEEEMDTAPLKAALREEFGTRPFKVEDAETFTVERTAYLRTHLRNRTFKPAEQAGNLEVVDPPATRRGLTYPKGKTVLRFTR